MVTARQCKMARAALGWSLKEVAAKVGVNINTIIRFEDNGDPRSSIRDRIEKTFTEAGFILHPDGRTVSDMRSVEQDREAA